MMSARGLVMPARKRGFWLRIAARSVLPERGIPEMKWNFRGDFATWGAAGMGALPCGSVMVLYKNAPTAVRRMVPNPGYGVRLATATGTLRVGTFHPLTSTTGVAALGVAECAVKVSDSPGHSVTSLSLHRIGSISSPPSDRLIDTCWNSATALEDGGTVSDRRNVFGTLVPHCCPDLARHG